MARRGSSTWATANYGKACTRADLVKLEWYPGQIDSVHRGTEKLWQALGAIMVAYKYKVRDADTGFYNCRPITGGSSMSNHAWPLAGDINWKTNPYKSTSSRRTIRWGVETDMPAAMVKEIESITASGFTAFKWGGRWRSIKDAMHYEIHVTLSEIAAGVKAPRGFYEGGGSAPEGDELSQLKKGHKPSPSAAVKKHQQALLAWNSKALPKFGADGDFGGETETWVKTYQKAAAVDQNGVIDGVTSSLLLTYLSGGGGKHKHPATVAGEVTVAIGEAG